MYTCVLWILVFKSVHIILWNPGQNRKAIAFWFKLADFEIKYSVIQGKFKFITFHSVSSAYINCHRVNAKAIFPVFPIPFKFIFIHVRWHWFLEYWRYILKCIFFEVQFREIPNDESLKRPTYASAWWKFNDDRRRILLIKMHLIKMQMKFKKTTPFITFCYVSLQTKTFKRFRW